jgi:hypothetical protein
MLRVQESKVVAYYCRAYAMTVAMDVRGADNSKEVMTFLMTFMDKLESEKKFLTRKCGCSKQ